MKAMKQSIERALESKLVEARKETMRRLGDIEHRLEFVDKVNDVEFVNDAKATDINSTWYSIDCISRPIVWIVNSSQYEDDCSLFDEIDAKKVRALIVMGTAKERVEIAFGERIKLIGRVNTMHEAVAHANRIAEAGDVVLFSPACLGYDSFKHYKEAGQQFRKAVRETRL